MQEFSKIIEFRQDVYAHAFPRARDAQFELLDALLLSPSIRSYPELSQSPVFRREWHSLYKAMENGRQDDAWLTAYLAQQIPTEEPVILSLDATAWPHPQARTLEDRQYVYSPTPAIQHHAIVAGHPYSILAWSPEAGSSWALPVSIARVPSKETDIEVGIEQVQSFCRQRGNALTQAVHLVVADGKYGNHHFLGALREEACDIGVRLRRDRVLYGPPGAYSGRGRPRVHGPRFAFKDSETWGTPDVETELEDARWGQVRLRRWDHLHARQDAETQFSVLLIEAHREREQPSAPLWVAYLHPQVSSHPALTPEDVWHGYAARWPIEPSIRFRKQALYWTLPRFQTAEACDRWTGLVTLAQWQLWWARDVVQDTPLPWQPAQQTLTPDRTRQSLGALFQQIGTPACPPTTRGKSPGWPSGQSRPRPQRHPVVRKTPKARASP